MRKVLRSTQHTHTQSHTSGEPSAVWAEMWSAWTKQKCLRTIGIHMQEKNATAKHLHLNFPFIAPAQAQA